MKVFFTGNDSVFSTSHLFGFSANLNNPITGIDTLLHGTNYFWLAYDISDTATIGNFLDASCLDYTIGGSGTHNPTVSSPPGKLTINYCIPGFGYPGGCDWGVGINSFSTSGGITNISNMYNGCPGNLYDYTFFSNQTVTAEQGASFLFDFISGDNYPSICMYIDWNQDFDFDDSGELVYNYWMPASDTVVVPDDAVPGTTRMRVIAYWQEQKGATNVVNDPGCPYFAYGAGETEDYQITVLPGSPMAYQSANVFQCDTLPPVTRGTTNRGIIGIKVNIAGSISPISATAFNLTSDGSTNFSHDISQARIYYTGHDSIFSAINLFNSASDLSAPITGNRQLTAGSNYFWVAYDARDTATIGNFLDAACNSIILTGSGTHVPIVTSPYGKQTIGYCIPLFPDTSVCSKGAAINNFSTTGGTTNITNLNNGCPANSHCYSNFTNQIVSVGQGSSFSFYYSCMGGTPSFFILADWNQDFDFDDENETVYVNTDESENELFGEITIPNNALIGSTRFRLITNSIYGMKSSITSGCGYTKDWGETEDYTINIIPATPTKTLNLTAFLEGLYPESGGIAMSKARNASDEQFPGTTADIITVELHDAVSPFMLAGGPYTANLNIGGTASLSIPAAFSASYYIVVKHRNSIQTWSANPVSFSGSTIYYNFSTAATTAYGNNLKQIGPLFLIYCGDVNQDGIVNALDQAELETAAVGFVMGYLTTDVNGDGIVDAFDLILTDNNAAGFVMVRKP